MNRTIFYSWQSTLSIDVNRSLIEEALSTAISTIRGENAVSVQPVIDRDTSGVAGSPEISNTIFRKIDASAVFVADVSIINSDADVRPTPNPNVLIELGYALRALGPERVLMVMNSHFGGAEMLPFDLRLRRVLTYVADPASETIEEARRELSSQMVGQLRLILEELDRADAVQPQKQLMDEFLDGVRTKRNDRTYATRQYLDDFFGRVFKLAPSIPIQDDEELVAALTATIPLVAEFAQACSLVATIEDVIVAETLYAGFGPILGKYDRLHGSGGTHHPTDFDYFRFIGHELFVTFIAPLLHEKRFEILKVLLSTEIEMPLRRAPHGRRMARFHELQQSTWILRARTERLNLMSSHATLLHDRHAGGDLGAAAPFDHFIGADYFLFLRSEVGAGADQPVAWFPGTCVYLSQTPAFLERLHQNRFAQSVAQVIGLSSIDALRNLVGTSARKLAKAFGVEWQGFPEANDPSLIGSR